MKMTFVHFYILLICFSYHWANLIQLEDYYSLECWNDYLFTISCVLNVSSDVLAYNATSWLEFFDYRDPYECVLTAHAHSWLCELDLTLLVEDTFTDTDFFQISLNSSYHGNSSSVVLNTSYKPVENIRPVAPSNLSMVLDSEKAVFYWLSGYDENIALVQNLQYQLSIQIGDKVFSVHPVDTRVDVEVSVFTPHTNYMARVRSVPNQVHYKGAWSEWGAAIYWTSGAAHIKSETVDKSFSSFWFALLCLLPVLGLVLSYIPYSKWKRHVCIPSPAPFIRDFKSSTMQPGIVGELLQEEQSLKIDSMIEDSDSAPPSSPTHYEKMRSVHEESEYIFSTPSTLPSSPSMLHSPPGVELSYSTWLEDLTAAERGSVTCSEDYCTVSHTLLSMLPTKTHTEHTDIK